MTGARLIGPAAGNDIRRGTGPPESRDDGAVENKTDISTKFSEKVAQLQVAWSHDMQDVLKSKPGEIFR